MGYYQNGGLPEWGFLREFVCILLSFFMVI